MAWTTPTTRSTGDLISASIWNTDVVNNLIHLHPVGARVYQAGDSAVSTATATAVPFGSETFDTDTMHDLVTATTRLTIKTAGTYVFIAQGEWAPNATGTRYVSIRKGGSTTVGYVESPNNGGGNGVAQTATAIYQCAVNDYFEMVVYQASGGNLNLLYVADRSPIFSAFRVAL